MVATRVGGPDASRPRGLWHLSVAEARDVGPSQRHWARRAGASGSIQQPPAFHGAGAGDPGSHHVPDPPVADSVAPVCLVAGAVARRLPGYGRTATGTLAWLVRGADAATGVDP